MDNDASVFVVTDQREREIIWGALSFFREMNQFDENKPVLDDLIKRVSETFPWMRNG